MLIITSITGFNTVFGATAIITIEDWESYNLGVTSGTGTYADWEIIDVGSDSLITTGARSGKCVFFDGFDDEATLYVNLTDDYPYIGKISIWVHGAGHSYEPLIYYYNDTDLVAYVYFTTGDGWWHSRIDGADVPFADTGAQEDGWLNISHISGNLMYYSWWNSDTGSTESAEGASHNTADWTNITRLVVKSGNSRFRIDDIIFDLEYMYDIEFGDISNYSYVGNIDYYDPLFRYDYVKYFEEKRFVKMNCDVKAVDLLVSDELHTENPDLSKYFLKINGYKIGNPDYWVPYNNNYLLRWIDFTVSLSLDNENPVLEFYHSEFAYDNKYWYGIGQTRSGDDIDKDGETTYRYHSNANQFNGIYDGSLFNADLIYRMYYIGEIFRPPRPYDDIIDTDKNSYEQYETVTISGSVSTPLFMNRLIVNKSGIEYVNRTIIGYTFEEFFTPKLEGTYNASIYRQDSGIVKTCSFTVTVTSLLHYIYTEPNPSRPIESFTVYFKYNYTTISCAIVLFNDENLVKPLKIWRYDTVPIEDSFVYSINTEGIYYFDLCSYHFDNVTNENIYTTIKRHRHICKNEYPNQINVVHDVVTLPLMGQVVYGSHNFLGSNIVVKMNGEVAFSVGGTSEFSEVYVPQYTGDYNATLELILSDTTIVLDYTLFSVSGDAPPPPPPPDDAVFGLPIAYMHAMFGAFITLGFLLLPLVLSLKSRHEISGVVYAVFGGIGLGVATLAGFFPLWLPLMITILVVTILVIEYKKGN